MHTLGLISLISTIYQPNAAFCFLNILSNFSSSTLIHNEEIITEDVRSSSPNAYQRWSRSCFNLDLVFFFP